MERWWDQLTIVIPSSPVPSNPSVTTLKAVFRSFANVPRLPEAQKLLHLDGIQPSLSPLRREAYIEFARRLGVLIATEPDFLHTQARSIQYSKQ